MYGNCLIFAIPDWVKKGGELYIEFWKDCNFPHFTVQRNEKVFDFGGGNMTLLKAFLFDGKKREFEIETYKRFPCKRVLLMKRRPKNELFTSKI